jgi:predicted O-methyltransferase YrrM
LFDFLTQNRLSLEIMRYFTSAVSLFQLYRPYFIKPAVWPEIWRREVRPRLLKYRGKYVPRKIYPDASGWCEPLAVTTGAAVEALGFELIDPETLHPESFTLAHRSVDSCPITMGAAGNLTLMYSLAEGLEAKRVIETGVAYGWSSLAFLLSLRKRQGRLFSIDLPYFKLRSDQWVGCVVPADLRANWKVYHCADREGLPKAIRAAGGSIDLAHYDSDKTHPGRLWGYGMLWDALRPGGILISDDIGDNPGFQDFAEQVGITPIIVRDHIQRYQGILRKP